MLLGEGAGGVQVEQQGDHADKAGDGENAHASEGLLAYGDLALRVVVAGRQDGGDAYPGGQKQAGVLGAACEVNDPRRQVREHAADGDQPYHGRLRRVIYQPPGHEAVGEVKGEGRGRETLWMRKGSVSSCKGVALCTSSCLVQAVFSIHS